MSDSFIVHDTSEPDFWARFHEARQTSPRDKEFDYCAARGDYFNDPFREAAGKALARATQGTQGTQATHSEPSDGNDLFLSTLTPAKETDADQRSRRN